MAKLTLADIAAGYTSTSTINANNALIEAALENTVSRDGTSPNTMSANLDMNSNQIKNVTDPTADQDGATKSYVDTLVASSVDGQISGSFNVGTSWDWTAQQDMWAGIRIGDTGQTDYVAITHDGTDVNFAFTNTTDLNFNDGVVVKIWDSGNTDNVAISHDGTDLKITSTNVSSVDFTGQSQVDVASDFRISGGNELRVYDAGADFFSIEHNGTDIILTSAGTDSGSADLSIDNVVRFENGAGVYIEEVANAAADKTGYGQLSVTNTSVQDLRFTDESGVDQFVTSQIKYKTADESVSSSTTLQDDNHITGISVVANGVYMIEGFFDYTQNVGDLKMNLIYTASPSKRAYSIMAVDEAGLTDEDCDNGGNDLILTGITDGGDATITLKGHLTMGGTGGTVKLQWAQNTSDANATTLRQGSWVKFTRIA